MRTTYLGRERRPKGVLALLRLAFGGSSHLWMWDEASMFHELAKAGFVDIRRCDYGDSGDPKFSQVEMRSRFFDDEHGAPELAVAARKPMD